MIEARTVSKAYDTVLAVDGVDLRVQPGEIVGLVGANGAGKTSLLRMLAGILPPTRGTIAIGGLELSPEAVEPRRRLAFVPDTPMLFDQLTVEEHLLFTCEVYGLTRAEQPARIDALLGEFELLDKRHATAASLSRGMRQKLAICCAFVHEPAALLLDEPLTGLDPVGRRRMCEAIAARARAGSAVLVSSHELEIVERICARFVILHRGRVRLAGTLAEMRSEAGGDRVLEDVFLRVTSETDGAAP